jgi:hypothetical protein
MFRIFTFDSFPNMISIPYCTKSELKHLTVKTKVYCQKKLKRGKRSTNAILEFCNHILYRYRYASQDFPFYRKKIDFENSKNLFDCIILPQNGQFFLIRRVVIQQSTSTKSSNGIRQIKRLNYAVGYTVQVSSTFLLLLPVFFRNKPVVQHCMQI